MNQNTSLIIVIVLQQGLFFLAWLVLAGLRMSRRATLHWAAGTLVVSAGLVVLIQRPNLSPWVGYWVSNALVLVGFTLARRGVEVFARQKPSDREHMVVLGVALAAVAMLDYERQSAQLAAIGSVAQAWILLRAGHTVLSKLSPEYGQRYGRAAASVFIGLGLVALLRSAGAVLRPDAIGQSLHVDRLANTYTVLAFLCAGLMLNLSLVGLVMWRMVMRLRHLSEHDALTALLNRGAVERRLQEEGVRLERYRQPFSMLAFDMDHFKAVNDRFGHPGGDAVLRELGQVVRRVARGSDYGGRSGGEEFWLVMPHTELAGALAVAQRLLMAVREMEVPGLPQQPGLSVSIGVAVCDRPGESHLALLQRVDAALYQAKREGRDRIVLAADH